MKILHTILLVFLILSSSIGATITVNSGSTFDVGAGTNPQNTNTKVVLNGGTLLLSDGGSHITVSQTFNSLTLTKNSSIDFSSLTGQTYLDFSSFTDSGGYVLNILNYCADNTTNYLRFDTVPSATLLSQIRFYSGATTSSGFLGTGEAFGHQITPIPEIPTYVGVLLILLFFLALNIMDAVGKIKD